jgi:hypothetical protein
MERGDVPDRIPPAAIVQIGGALKIYHRGQTEPEFVPEPPARPVISDPTEPPIPESGAPLAR